MPFDTPFIQSVQNSKITRIVRLREKARERENAGQFFVEGRENVQHALNHHWPISQLLLCEAFFPKTVTRDSLPFEPATLQARGMQVVRCAEPVFRKLSGRSTPDGVAAVARRCTQSLDDLRQAEKHNRWLVTVGIEKPGNLGALWRTANVAGIQALVVADSVCEPFHPQAVHNSRGAAFSVPVCLTSSEVLLTEPCYAERQWVVACPEGTTAYHDIRFEEPYAVVVGAEAEGLPSSWKRARSTVYIPNEGTVDSLNVSGAATVLLFEAQRQRYRGRCL